MTNQTNKSTITYPDDMSFTSVQVFAWSCALATKAVVIVVGNLLTIVLFAFNKKLRSKKSLYLVLNMAFADLFFGGVCLPMCVYFLARLPLHGQVKLDEKTPTIFRSIFFVFAQHHSLPLLWYVLRDFTPSIGRWSTGRHFLRERTGSLFWRSGHQVSLVLFL